MKIYNYKGIDYYSVTDLVKKLPKISLPKIKELPDEVLVQLKVKIRQEEISQEVVLQRMQEVRHVRDKMLRDSDKYVLPDFPFEQLDRDNAIAYRQYLRDYTMKPDWWKAFPQNLFDWTMDGSEFYE